MIKPMISLDSLSEPFDFDKARAELAVPERFRIEAAIAIGRRGDKASLPEALQAREAPSGRHEIETFAHQGNFIV